MGKHPLLDVQSYQPFHRMNESFLDGLFFDDGSDWYTTWPKNAHKSIGAYLQRDELNRFELLRVSGFPKLAIEVFGILRVIELRRARNGFWRVLPNIILFSLSEYYEQFHRTQGGTCTLTARRPPDFKSGASTIPPPRLSVFSTPLNSTSLETIYRPMPPIHQSNSRERRVLVVQPRA